MGRKDMLTSNVQIWVEIEVNSIKKRRGKEKRGKEKRMKKREGIAMSPKLWWVWLREKKTCKV